MTDLILPRRKLLTGLGALFCAPAIVRASSLMPVHAIPPEVITSGIKYLVQVHFDEIDGKIYFDEDDSGLDPAPLAAGWTYVR